MVWFQPILRSLVFIVVASFSPGFAQADDLVLEKILELSTADNLTIDTKTIIEHCSRLLDNREKENRDKVLEALAQRGLAYLSEKNFSAAERDFKDLCLGRPKNAEVRCLHAQSLVGLNRFQEAREETRIALQLEPKSPLAHFNVANDLWSQGDVSGCLRAIEGVIALDPKYSSAYLTKGIIYQDIDPVRSLECINKYLELSPYFPLESPEDVYYYKGRSLSWLNRPKEALSCFLMASKLNCKSHYVIRELSMAYGELGRYHLATHYAEVYVGLAPDVFVGYALAAAYSSKCDRVNDARKMAEKVLWFAEKDKTFPCAVADVQSAVGEYGSALTYYDKALEGNPEHFLALLGKASLLGSCPDPQFRNGAEGIKLAQRALERKKTREFQKWQPTMVLAEAYAETGDFQQAVRFAEQALELAGPDFGRRQEFIEKLSHFHKGLPWRMTETR